MEKENKKFLASQQCKAFQDLLEEKIAETHKLDKTDHAFLEEHAGACPDCAAFTRALQLVGEEPPVSSEERNRLIERAWAGLHARRRRRRAVFAGISTAAALMILVFAFFIGYADGRQPELRLVKGRVIEDGAEAGPGYVLRGGEDLNIQSRLAVIESEGILTMAMDQAARMSVMKLEKTGLDIHLHSGMLAIRLEHAQQFGIRVRTLQGKVAVIGTIFAVKVGNQDVRVDVVQGAVHVTPSAEDKKAITVKAGWSLLLGENKKIRLDEPTSRRILAMLSGNLEEAGEAPEAAGGKITENVEKQGKIKESGPVLDKQEGIEAKKEHSEKPTLKGLFYVARSCRVKKDWTCAADAYKKITILYPGSPEAVTVLVPLADIQLDHLKAPEKSLQNFERYLKKRPGGSLAKEALYGKILALRKLGRKNKEINALKQFLKLYPDSLEAPKAEKRLKAITK